MFWSDLGVEYRVERRFVVPGDFSKFIIVDAIGSSIRHNPLVLGANRRPIGAESWTYFFRVGSDVVVPENFRMLVVLVASTGSLTG